jgi:hypothetical protein
MQNNTMRDPATMNRRPARLDRADFASDAR